MSKLSYRELHEQFMQNHTGTTPLESIWVIAPTAITIILANCVSTTVPHLMSCQPFLVEFLVLVMPLILNSTVLSDHIAQSLLFMVLLSVSYIFTFVSGNRQKHKLNWNFLSNTLDIRILKTNFRGIVSVITAICILAVDFHTFPRRFAKTEVQGWGIMDTGVGLFVVANGLVDPAARGQISSMESTVRGCVPLLLLGFARCFSLWWLDYQQHDSEYGLHWNFFITLAVTRFISTAMLQTSNRPLSWAVLCIKTHHVILVGGLAGWVLGDEPRDNFLSANREGVCSILGYVAIHQCSITLSQWFAAQSDKKLVLPKLTSFSAVMWLVAIILGPPSRRLADVSYIAWILAYSTTILSLCIVAQYVSFTLGLLTSAPPYNPKLLAAVNFNILPFFLLANLLTGVINMSVDTLYVAPAGSVLILTTYMFLLCFTSHKLFTSRIKMKFW